jgi:hypothetical protein
VYGTVHCYTLCYIRCVSTEHTPWIMWDLKWRRAPLKDCVCWIVHSFIFSVFCELHKNFATVISLDTSSSFRCRLMENTSHEFFENKVSILRELLYRIKRHTDGSYSIIFLDTGFWVAASYWGKDEGEECGTGKRYFIHVLYLDKTDCIRHSPWIYNLR